MCVLDTKWLYFFHLGFDLHSKNDFRWFVLLIKMANATVVVCKDSWSTYFHCFQPTKNRCFFVFLGVQCFLLPSAGTMITFVTCNWRGIFSSQHALYGKEMMEVLSNIRNGGDLLVFNVLFC